MISQKFLLLFLVVFLFSVLTLPVFAAEAVDTGTEPAGRGPVGDCAPGELCNPLRVNDPRIIIGNIIKAALGIVGSLALAVFIYGGFTWVISAGNDDKIKKGKDMIVWATIGLAVIFTSYALVTFVIGAVAGTSSG